MRYVYTFLISSILLYTACRPDDGVVDGGVRLRLEIDTLRFDTVFTQVGSITRSVKIYNDLSDPILIDAIRLRESGSPFRLNVDGYQGNDLRQVRIEAKDSIYLFAEVTVDPDMPLSMSPFIMEQLVDISVAEETTTLVMEAFGQNANYVSFKGQGTTSLLSCDLGRVEWDDPKPYVIYGILVIDSCELVLPPGTDVYFHGGLVRADSFFYSDGLLAILPQGRLTVQGTIEEPVTMQSDRLETDFDEVSGQWNGIRFFAGSRGNAMTHTTIRHPITGIVVDSSASLSIDASVIEYASAQGLVGINADITATNCLIHNTGAQGIQLANGGNYQIDYCTVANYGNQAPAISISNNVCTDPLDLSTCRSNPLRASIRNSVLTGNSDEEVSLSDISVLIGSEVFDYQFEHCAVRFDEIPEAYPDFEDRFVQGIFLSRRDTVFADIGEVDFRPDSLSILEGRATPLSSTLIDLLGNSRDGTSPDIGCYEYQY